MKDLDMDDEAEEDKLFGEDENTHMLGWANKPQVTEKDMQLKEAEEDEEDGDWEEEFNKFYDSPFDKIDEVRWLENVLKGEAIQYCNFMTPKKQEEIAFCFSNAPAKNQ